MDSSASVLPTINPLRMMLSLRFADRMKLPQNGCSWIGSPVRVEYKFNTFSFARLYPFRTSATDSSSDWIPFRVKTSDRDRSIATSHARCDMIVARPHSLSSFLSRRNFAIFNSIWEYVAPSTYPTADPASASVKMTRCGYPPDTELQYSHGLASSRGSPAIA